MFKKKKQAWEKPFRQKSIENQIARAKFIGKTTIFQSPKAKVGPLECSCEHCDWWRIRSYRMMVHIAKEKRNKLGWGGEDEEEEE